MRKCIVTEPSSLQEEVQEPKWVDAMVEEYDSIVRNNAWEIIPRLVDKSVVGSRWIYKVSKLLMGVLRNTRPYLWPEASHRSRGLIIKKPLHLSHSILL